MPLNDQVKKGDWVLATNTKGAMLEGQAENDVSWGGDATLKILLDKDSTATINVNYWDVSVTHSNLL